MRRLMMEHRLDILGTRLTMMEMMKGFSLGYSLFLAWLGAAILLALSLGHFPPPPTIFAGLIFAAFGASLLGRGSPPS
jgi:hypothetical protein